MSAFSTERTPSAPSIAYDVQGDGPLVVFLHGIGGNRENWRRQLTAFAPHFKCVAWDARGYGDSDDYDGPLRVEDFSADLIRLLDHLGAGTAHVVGLSMGGLIAQDFYYRHGDRVASLVLCDTSAGLAETMTDDQIDAFLAARQKPLLEGKEPADIAPQNARNLMSPGAGEDVYEELVKSLASVRKEAYLKTLEGVTRYRTEGKVEDIDVPCLVVCGADDPLTTPDMSRDMHARINGAELCIIDDAGHLSNIEQPAAFNDAVLDFLQRTEKAG